MQHDSAVSHHSGHAGKRRVLVLEPRTGITWNHSLVLSLHCWASKQHQMGLSRYPSVPPSHTKISVQGPYTSSLEHGRRLWHHLQQLTSKRQVSARVKRLSHSFKSWVRGQPPLKLPRICHMHFLTSFESLRCHCWKPETRHKTGAQSSPPLLQFNLNSTFSIHPLVYVDNILESAG